MYKLCYKLLLSMTVAVGISWAMPALTQEKGSQLDAGILEEVIVTARRREERLQDVPISITMFNQQQLDDRNIVSMAELGAFTPSLSVNERFGQDHASFALRGFTQVLRTTASVGVYFADVVSQRAGQNSVTSGDGGGPGSFFDLANVQVLKGPQGTLFGRNTTGGAVLLVPNKPTDEFEGYIEASIGDYDMERIQGVVNLPLSDRVRLRLGVEYHERDGYLDNEINAGPGELGSTDYTSGRASLVVDLTENLENYTIVSYTDSEPEPETSRMIACLPAGTPSRSPILPFSADQCRDQLARSQGGFHDVFSQTEDPESEIQSWQVINTTTWDVTDKFTVKAILSYGELETQLRSALFGNDWRIPASDPVVGGIPFVRSNVNPNRGGPTSDQENFVAELQFQGQAFDDRLVYQAGLYYEDSSPAEKAGNVSMSLLSCPDFGDRAKDLANDASCQDVVGQHLFGGFAPVGSLTDTLSEFELTNKAVFGEMTFKLNDQFELTAGVRYTWDESEADLWQKAHRDFPFATVGPPATSVCTKTTAVYPNCYTKYSKDSEDPTWVLGVNYFPMDDIMLYAKYTRGYRQGSVAPFAAEGFEDYEAEEVDTYEIGAKTSWGGTVPGNFNISVFYNDLENQQIQMGMASFIVASTTAIVNAGKSNIQGLEIETRLMPFEGFTLEVGYTYLDTELEEQAVPSLPAGSLFFLVVPLAVEGDDLPLSPQHKAQVTATYQLPISADLGDASVGMTYVYTDSQLTSTRSPFGMLDSYEVVNFQLNWRSVGGSSFDASLFVNNAFDEEYWTYVPGVYTSFGAEYASVGRPKMYGGRLRYNF